MAQGTFWAALQGIADHRTRKGRRFPLPAIIAISLCAMLSGANDLMAIFRWGRRLSPRALQALGVDKKRRKAPATPPTTTCSSRLPPMIWPRRSARW